MKNNLLFLQASIYLHIVQDPDLFKRVINHSRVSVYSIYDFRSQSVPLYTS